MPDSVPFSYSTGSFNAEDEEIELYGSLSVSTRSSVIRPIIQAFKNSTALRANFLYNVGDMAVVICSENGNTVYEREVNTSEEDQLLIDLSTLDPGTYEIRFINTEGQFVFGEFEIN